MEIERSKISKRRQLNQVELTTANATTVYNPSYGVRGAVQTMFVTNYTSSSASYSIYQDADGNTTSNATALFISCPITANTTDIIEVDNGIIVDGTDSGTLIFQSNTANALTITLYGEEITS